ncbi:NlpC/P60 family protein [Alkalibaculum bacchi]|uniref:NlpC/P60 family protein n=1 Tax=Alkalibaculum bacchi TaxID=645887 RepID=A0A366I179_9FIRM|nr:bifunctional lytic transglycosylase/C40 family peptidase [Alkalibaculum bacchi]RBP59335.1 NlpC/P60 family protein [Alkalibaculum bacchi]
MQNNIAVDSIRRYKKFKKLKIFLGLQTLIIVFAFLMFLLFIGMLSSASKNKTSGAIANINLSETTLQWQDEVIREAQKQGVPELVPYIMAIIEVESKGTGTADIMQSSESAGLGRNGFDNPLDSIEQGIKYLKSAMTLALSSGCTDVWGTIQSYNFGTSYVSYLGSKGANHSIEVAEDYSKKVVAPSLGNHTGAIYSYVNAVSQSYGKTYLYRNGGNFFYADLVRQYVILGSTDIPMGNEIFQSVMEEALKYEGNPYVWGGDTASVGFDCSGLTQWVYRTAGISLPRTAKQQWGATVEVSLKDAQPGDLIFFKGTYGGPHHISHVGIYIDETRMYDSNNGGIGYHYWTSNYWASHFDSIRRIVK